MQYDDIKTVLDDYRQAYILVQVGNGYLSDGIAPNSGYLPAKRIVAMVSGGFGLLDERQLTAFTLHYIKHYSRVRASQYMGISVDQYYRLKRKACLILGQYLEHNDDFNGWYQRTDAQGALYESQTV